MNTCALRFIRPETSTIEGDDLIVFRECNDNLHVHFFTSEINMTRSFYLGHEEAIEYITNILRSLPFDSDPYEHLQVETSIHPTVLYRVSDLVDRNVRYLIEDMVASAIHHTAESICSRG